MFLDAEVRGQDGKSYVLLPGALRCQSLISSGQVWDFRDVFIGICNELGPTRACKQVFGPAEVQPFQCLLEFLSATEPDESTLLALLDIFTHMALSSAGTTGKAESFASVCLDYADMVGGSLLQKFPGSLKCRPVLL